MAVTLTPPKYDEDAYRKKVTGGQFYDTAIQDYTADAEKQRATQIGEAQKNQQSALKQAYIQRVQNQNKLNQNLAMSGIRGGMTETANLNLANQYGQARAAANTDYANSVNTINQNIDANIRDYTADMRSRKEEYIQNQANAIWQADREDALNQYNAQNEFWNNYYMDYYSGASKKTVQKALKTAQTEYKNAKTDAARLQALQKIRGIQARLGVINNK